MEKPTVVAEGDSLTYGQDTTAQGVPTQINGASQTRNVSPYPETLEKILRHSVKVLNHGFPGDRTVDGLVRWQASAPASMHVIMFGTNDAINAGGWATGALTLETFGSVLSLLIGRRTRAGERVIVISPPPMADKSQDLKIQRYAEIARSVSAAHSRVIFVDIRLPLLNISNAWTDGLHLTSEANTVIAEEISKIIVRHGL